MPCTKSLFREVNAVITIALYKNNHATLIDERKARRIARTIYGLEIFGTVRVLLEAKKAGLIGSMLKSAPSFTTDYRPPTTDYRLLPTDHRN
jgi:hypothetical protein